MRHLQFPALLGALGLSAMMALLRTEALPPWFAQSAAFLLPPACLYAALHFAARRTKQLRRATQLHQAEQQRLMIACQLLHSRVDLLTAQRRRLLERLEAMQEPGQSGVPQIAPLRRVSGQ